jgi:hypothetical protein
MSEFLSTCPKCRQRILCDTTYIGVRVACPLCLQEITLPAPPVQSQPPTPASNSEASLPSLLPPVPSRKRTNPLIVAAGVLVFIIAAGVIIGTHKSRRTEAKLSSIAGQPATTLNNRANASPAAPPTLPVAPTVTAHPPAPPALPVAQSVSTPPPAPPSTVPWITPKAKFESLRPTMASGRRPVSPEAQTASASESINACRAHWTFDQLSGATALDSSGNGFDATLVGDQATWTKDGRGGAGALNLAGDGYAETSGPVVDTSRSFTVAAWVKFDAIDKRSYQTVVGIDGTLASAFYLQLNHAAGDRFVFHRREKDDDKALVNPIWAKSDFSPDRNIWYHLAGVYDAEAQTISLYVDGKLQESVPFISAWQGSGKTSIGRGLFSGANRDFVKGSIADVRLYAAVLTSDQIQALAAPFQDLAAK